MKAKMRFLALFLCFAMAASSAYAEDPAAAPSVESEVKMEPAPGTSPAAASASPSPDAAAPPSDNPDEQAIFDFDDGNELVNKLGGESGSWNLDPMDENNSYTDADLVEMPGKDGEMTFVLRLNYSVDSDVPSQNGFWTKLKGFDASGLDHLQFDVKGDAEKGFTDRFKIEIKKFKDAEKVEKIKGSQMVNVSADWQTVSIPLNKLTGLVDFGDPKAWENPSIARRDLDEFVVVFQDRHVSKKTGTIYLDNIKFIKTGEPGPTAVDFPPRTKEKTETKIEGLEFAKFLVNRLGGFPKELVVKKEFPADDKEFLREIAKDTWRFFDEIVDQEHGLVLDTIQLGKTQPLDEGTMIGDYTNVTNIGVYFMCVVSGYDLGFIPKEEAIRRIKLTMSTMEKVQHHESGFPFNYYDTTTAERTSYFVSLVDSGWLVAGLYVAKNAFPEDAALVQQAERLINRGKFSFFYDPVERQMYHGYYEHLQTYSDYHYGVFYTEPRAISYMAIARGEVPEDHWFMGLTRTFPEEYTWQTQTPVHREKKKTLDYEYLGGWYEWKDLKYIPSWGGSGFEALMPTMIIDEKGLAPEGLGKNNHAHVLGQIRYALEELQMPVWGMSPSSKPEGGYTEYGAKPFGAKGYKAGAVTPHAVVLGVEYEPEKVVANLRKLIELYDIYGEYGFYDAVTVIPEKDNPNSKPGLVARKYLALDQGMLFVALNNYLNDGAIRKRFHADPVMKNGERILSAEKFFEIPASAETASADQPAAA
jgi:hypothetical protein